MLNPIRKSVGLALVILGLSLNLSSQAFAVGGDRGPGNGGDGLEMNSVKTQGTVVVPIPEGIGSRGYLRVEGTLGRNQSNYETYIERCAQDANGKPAKLSCGSFQAVELNKLSSLAPGLYKIHSPQSDNRQIVIGAAKFVTIETGKTTTLVLSTIRMPNLLDRSLQYQVMLDYTSPQTQQAIAEDLFTEQRRMIGNPDTYDCKRESQSDSRIACFAWHNATSASALIGKAVFFPAFENDKNFHYPRFWSARPYSARWENISYAIELTPDTAELTHGELSSGQEATISVLPGVYAIRYTDTETGETQTQTGVVVE